MSNTLTIRLPEQLLAQLREKSRQVVREALEKLGGGGADQSARGICRRSARRSSQFVFTKRIFARIVIEAIADTLPCCAAEARGRISFVGERTGAAVIFTAADLRSSISRDCIPSAIERHRNGNVAARRRSS